MNNVLLDKLLELIHQKYGSLTRPNFMFAHGPEPYKRYAPVFEQLSRQFTLQDVTEPNLDVAVAYKLAKDTREWLLAISLLGPVAVFTRLPIGDSPLTREFATSSEEKSVIQILDSFEITLIEQSILEIPIDLTLSVAEPGHVHLYHALIGDSTLLPWRTKVNNWWPLRGENGLDHLRETDAP